MVKKITKLHVLIFAIVFASCTGGEERGFPEPIDKSKDVGVKKDVETKKDLSNDVIQKTDHGVNPTDVAEEKKCDPKCSASEVCDKATLTCVGCLADSDCTDQLCDLDSNTCVDCLDNTTCTVADASVCRDGECGECKEDSHCSHIADTTRCDQGVCKDGCSLDLHCGGKVCDRTTNLCTTKNPGTVGQCMSSCVSNTDCIAGHSCVPMEFPVGTPSGNYCLKRAASNNLPFPLTSFSCDKPFSPMSARENLGPQHPVSFFNPTLKYRYCGPKEAITTCEAVLAKGNDCARAVTIGTNVIYLPDQSRCPEAGGCIGLRCSYDCDNNRQCAGNCIDGGLAGGMVCD